jgi:histidinol-phosphate aminotransferase
MMSRRDPMRGLGVFRQDVQSMHAYAIQPSEGMVKLDAMENPHRLPPELQEELGRRLGALALNRYPGERTNQLRDALAAHAGMPEGFEIMLGNGSDELISLIAMACDVPGAAIQAPVPGFVMYAMSAQLQGLKFIGVPLTADFELDGDAMLTAIAEQRPADPSALVGIPGIGASKLDRYGQAVLALVAEGDD